MIFLISLRACFPKHLTYLSLVFHRNHPKLKMPCKIAGRQNHVAAWLFVRTSNPCSGEGGKNQDFGLVSMKGVQFDDVNLSPPVMLLLALFKQHGHVINVTRT